MSLTANELRLMMERGHRGHLFVEFQNLCGIVSPEELESQHDSKDYVQLTLVSGRVYRVPKMRLFSATRIQVEAAYAADLDERNRLKESKYRVTETAKPITPFRVPTGVKTGRYSTSKQAFVEPRKV